MWSTAFRVLDVAVAVATDHADVAEILGNMTATYEPVAESECSLRYRLLGRPALALEIDGQVVERPSHWLDLAPLFERSLYDEVLARSLDEWILHGAALASDHGAVVLIGASDAGKSTLALALTAAGLSYIADELVALDGTLQVRGVTRPISFTNRPPGDLPAGFDRFRYPFRGPLGTHAAILASPPPERLCRSSQPLFQIITLAPGETSPARLEPLAAGEGLCALWDQTMRRNDAALRRAAELLDGVTVHRLHSAAPEAARQAVLDWIGRAH